MFSNYSATFQLTMPKNRVCQWSNVPKKIKSQKTERDGTEQVLALSRQSSSRNAFDHFYSNNDYSVIKIYNFLYVLTISMPASLSEQCPICTVFSHSHVCVWFFCWKVGFSAILLVDLVCTIHWYGHILFQPHAYTL